MTSTNGQPGYEELLLRIREAVQRRLPEEATVAVVTKGDDELLKLEGRQAWHFPQRGDGVYAGYYPADSNSAIAHLEALRARGAQYLLVPGPALWWLDHYGEFAEHLEAQYQLVLREPDVCVIYALSPAQTSPHPERANLALANSYQADAATMKSPGGAAERGLGDYVDERLIPGLRLLLDIEYYGEQAGRVFSSVDVALVDYFKDGVKHAYNPHPLFDSGYYLSQYPEITVPGINPLVHFLLEGAEAGYNPHPYFDTSYYAGQAGFPRESQGANPLIHYLTHHDFVNAPEPNPLFGNRYYLNNNHDVKSTGLNPLLHYVKFGWKEGRLVSRIHQDIFRALHGSSRASLMRGRWRSDQVLLFSSGTSYREARTIQELAKGLGNDYHLNSATVVFRRQELSGDLEQDGSVVVLEDYEVACEIFRHSALQMLVKLLQSSKPLFAVSGVANMLPILKLHRIPTYCLYAGRLEEDREQLEKMFQLAQRVIFNSTEDFHAVGKEIGAYPANVALRPYAAGDRQPAEAQGKEAQELSAPDAAPGTQPLRALECGAAAAEQPRSTADYVASWIPLVERDLRLPLSTRRTRESRSGTATRKIIVPCSDWNISGVNSALESIGKELIRLGWDFEILFTRESSEVLRSAAGGMHLPQTPYRFLGISRPGVVGAWEALIAYLESNAPCIIFTGYDFWMNGVVAALTDSVGAVGWIQADDYDYYEQTYRLGRYCNALVGVAERIKEKVAELNPLIGEKVRVIHNSSVSEQEIVLGKRPGADKLRLLYAGRLVQYQKRVLDYIDLARSLDRTGIPYEITLIGEFSARENARQLFMTMAREQIEDGRIRLRGRLSRDEILLEMREHDFFVLLSEFEGLPLALVEAMASGCLPVAAEVESGIPEVISSGENGLILPGRNYDEWAEALADLWTKPRRLDQMVRRAQQTVRERLTVEQVARQFDELFRDVAEEIRTGEYRRPRSLSWGEKRSPTGDVLPPPNLFGHRLH